MNPDEKALLERTFRLSEDNNKILRKLNRNARWAVMWGFIKIAIIIVPLVAGYIYLQPFLGEAARNFESIKELY